MNDGADPGPSGHIQLLAGQSAEGKPVMEVVPAAPVDDGLHQVLGTPGLAVGCAAGDVIRLAPTGEFEVVRRGGNLALHVYMHGLTAESVDALRDALSGLQALVEAPADFKFAVVTVPVAAGFGTVERAMEEWHSLFPKAEWGFGNVYGEDGISPLNWW